MSRLDQRVKSVELRPINLLTESQVTAAVATGETTTGQDPTTVIAIDAPKFVKVVDAIAYPKKYTGSTDLVEIYLEADLELSDGDRLEVSGIHGTADVNIDVDGDNFKILGTDTPPWTGRKLTSGKPRHDPSTTTWSTVTNTYTFQPETAAPTTWTRYYRLQTRKKVDSYSITGTTVTLTLNSAHKFQAEDVFFVDIFTEDSRAYGIDGLFRIDSVTSNTIVYTLDAGGVDTPVPTTIPDADVYVYPVAKKYLAPGSTWADSANNKIYYWNGIRWVDYSLVADPVRDGDPPAAPTNLQITSEGVVSTNVSFPTAKVTLSWTAPTLTKAGEPLEDLIGYRIKWRRTTGEDWRIKDVPVITATSYTLDDDAIFAQGKLYYFQLIALDSGQQESDPVSKTHTTAIKTTPISAVGPTAPIIESKLGTMTVKWNGLLATTPPSNPPADLVYLKIHRSTVSGFTPSDSTLIATISAVANNYAIFSDVQYNTDYYFRFVVSDSSGVQSLVSAQSTARVTPLVNTDLLVANVLNSWSFAGNLISAGALADGSISAASLLGPNVITQNAIAANAIGANQIAANSIIAGKIGANAITANTVAANAISAGAIQANAIEADKIKVGALDGKLITGATVRTSNTNPRVEMNNTGLYAYNSGGGLTFRILSSDGSVYIASGVQIGGYATSGQLDTVSNTANTASSTANTASNTAANALSTADGKITKGEAANDINISTTTIDGDKITTGTLDADRIKASSILGGTIRTATSGARIEIRGANSTAPGIVGYKASGTAFRLYSNGMAYLDDVIADTITVGSTGTITGGIVRTSASGQRVEIRGDTDSVQFRSSSGLLRGEIEGIDSGLYLSSGTLTGSLVVGSGIQLNDSNGTIASFTNSGQLLTVVGTTTSAANMRRPSAIAAIQIVSSDSRVKHSVEPITSGLSVVSQLSPVTFNSKVDDTDKLFSGFLAQDVANVLPIEQYTVVEEVPNVLPAVEGAEELGFDVNPMLTLNHIELIPYLTKAIQELSEKNAQLEARLEALEGN
jgi:hypothetical protein